MKIKIEDVKALRLYGSETEGSTLSLKVGKTNGGNGGTGVTQTKQIEGNG